MASAVLQPTYEIGIRLALGASPTDVLKMVIRQGMIVAAIGVALGLGGAYVLTKYLESWMNIVTLRQMGLNGGFPTNTVNTRTTTTAFWRLPPIGTHPITPIR